MLHRLLLGDARRLQHHAPGRRQACEASARARVGLDVRHVLDVVRGADNGSDRLRAILATPQAEAPPGLFGGRLMMKEDQDMKRISEQIY